MSFFAPKRGSSNTNSSTGTDRPTRLVPWVEKYRPKCVDDISHQDEVVESLRGAIKSGNLPHLLFYGPPGTGKTSTVLAAAHELFGSELFSKRVLELNASDERGISVIRDKVKSFAQTAVSKDTVNGKPAPPFKIIILDEADSMTMDAQSALRRTMEKYTRVTRFCLICNYVSRIIEPLASRCAKFRFQPLSNAPMQARLEHIADSEGIRCVPDAIATILDQAQGDMRRAITLMQSASQYSLDGVVNSKDVIDLSGSIPPEYMDKIWSTVKTHNYAATENLIVDLVAGGFSTGLVIQQLFDRVLEDAPEVSDSQRIVLCTKLAEADKALECGASEEIQLRDVLLSFCKVFV